MQTRYPRFVLCYLSLFVCLALSLAVARLPDPASPAGMDASDRDHVRQSEQIVRRLEALNGPLATTAYLLGTPAPAPFLSVDCATPSGEHLANLDWDRRTGELLSLSRPLRPGRSEPGRRLTESEASARAVRWLRLLGLFDQRETRLFVVCQRAERHWDFRIASPRRQVRALVERRTGEIVLVDILSGRAGVH